MPSNPPPDLQSEEYIREGDIVLIDSKDSNSITEVQITDISPTGKYIEVTSNSHNRTWVHSKRIVETLKPANDANTEWYDVDETANDILAKIRNRAGATSKKDSDIEIIQLDKFAELDLRNKKK